MKILSAGWRIKSRGTKMPVLINLHGSSRSMTNACSLDVSKMDHLSGAEDARNPSDHSTRPSMGSRGALDELSANSNNKSPERGAMLARILASLAAGAPRMRPRLSPIITDPAPHLLPHSAARLPPTVPQQLPLFCRALSNIVFLQQL